MLNEPQISFGQALEVFQGQVNVKANYSHVAQNILCNSNFFCAMRNQPPTSFSQALEVFQGQISVKVNGCHVAQNMVCRPHFFGIYA